jgi:hypothetical protein
MDNIPTLEDFNQYFELDAETQIQVMERVVQMVRQRSRAPAGDVFIQRANRYMDAKRAYQRSADTDMSMLEQARAEFAPEEQAEFAKWIKEAREATL